MSSHTYVRRFVRQTFFFPLPKHSWPGCAWINTLQNYWRFFVLMKETQSGNMQFLISPEFKVIKACTVGNTIEGQKIKTNSFNLEMLWSCNNWNFQKISHCFILSEEYYYNRALMVEFPHCLKTKHTGTYPNLKLRGVLPQP